MSEELRVIIAEVSPRPDHPEFYTLQSGTAIGLCRNDAPEVDQLFPLLLKAWRWDVERVESHVHPDCAAAMRLLPRAVLEEVALRSLYIRVGCHPTGEGPEFEAWLDSIIGGSNS